MKRTKGDSGFFKADGSQIISSPTRFSEASKFPAQKSLEDILPKTSFVLTLKKKEGEQSTESMGMKK